MLSLNLASSDSVIGENIKENIIKASNIVKEYARTRKEVVYGGIGIAVGIIITANYGPRIRKRFFAWLNSKAVQLKSEDYEKLRAELFAPLADVKSHDPELRKENAIRILEIGVGSGTNLNLYPDGCHLVVVDPNPFFAKYYNENRAKYPNIKSESVIVSTGENMDMVKSESVDVVVTTAVLCSVNDLAKVVSQVKRVLVPGGKYFFMEHVQEWDREKHGIRWLIQHALSFFIWPFMFDGCQVNRDPLPTINAVGFSDVKAEQLYAPMPLALFLVCSPHLRGVATK